MVLHKRKPVKFEPLPPFLDNNTEVWEIETTGEIFTDYEKYLARRDFYLQKNFTCESTGHTNYTYFEALESEMEASKEINSFFPEHLKGRVLSFVQFQHTPRMDDLVNLVFEQFREQYMLYDRVAVEHENLRRYGVITDVQEGPCFPFYRNIADGPRSVTFTVTLNDTGEQVHKSRAADIARDRRVYSKLIIKQFLRSAVTRENWSGAPWTVKASFAKRYNINTKVPEEKTRESVAAARKQANAANPPNARHPLPPLNGPHAEPVANAPGFPINGLTYVQQNGQPTFVNFPANPPPFLHQNGQMQGPHGHMPPRPPFPGFQPPLPPGPLQLNGRAPSFMGPPQIPPNLAHLIPPHTNGLTISLPFQNNFMQYQTIAPTAGHQQQYAPPVTVKPFEPVRYPIEDLEIRQPRVSVERPKLKFFSDDVPEDHEAPEQKTGILMNSMGALLCSWETLNVHDVIYALDSFTFDDFAEAMRYSSSEEPCELFVEIHCSVLKQVMDDKGKFNVHLPLVDESDESDEEESSEEATPEREETPPKRQTRSSARKSEIEAIAKRTPTPEPPKELHAAAEFFKEFDWKERLKIRYFSNGGWEAIMACLLYTLSFSPVHKDACDEILGQLVPPGEDSTPESIAEQYVNLDVNLRIKALEIVLMLTVSTEFFREQLIQASQEMTRLRKEKIEFQKKRKELADELFKLDNERKIQYPLNMPTSPILEATKEVPEANGVEETNEEADAVSEEAEEPKKGNRKLRHTSKNKRKREEAAARREKEKKRKEAENAKTKQQKIWEKLLDDIQKKKEELKTCEASINELDDDLREANVQRSRLLGKDRFLNKYYWFEHNGMPFGGVPNSSTAEYGYANGRIWVQGPDEHEFQPNLEEPCLTQDRERFGFTIPERKAKEEGDTHLTSAKEWGYYDDPSDLDGLVAWLDERGVREKALRKELQLYRDRIAEYMIKMKEHLVGPDKSEDEEEKPAPRTRNKVNAESRERCLAWTNSILRSEMGYVHSDEYEPPQPKKAKRGTATVKTAATKKKGGRK